MENLNRMLKLFSDWSSTQDYAKNKKMRSILEESTKNSSNFVKVFSEMGIDGEKFKTLFEESWEKFDDNKTLAKRVVAQAILKEEYNAETPEVNKNGSVVSDIGMSYMPIADMKGSIYDSNAMQSTVTDGDRDILIQIRYAITAGNYAIAEALLLNFWPRLSVKERIDIISWGMNLGKYNSLSEVPKSHGVNFKSLKDKIEKKEVTKEEFKDAFLRTVKENMKIS